MLKVVYSKLYDPSEDLAINELIIHFIGRVVLIYPKETEKIWN
jgi:hypothetical protein